MGDDGTEEHLVRGGNFVAAKRRADHEGAGHGDDGELLVTEGLLLRSDFGFAIFELSLPTIEIRFDPAALTLAEVVEFEERPLFFAVAEGGLDHGPGGRGDPGFGGLEGEVSDLKRILGGEKGEGEGPENGDEFHGGN